MESYLDQTPQGYSYSSLSYGDPAYSSSVMERTVSEHTDRSGRSAGSNDTHWSAGEYSSQTSPVLGFDQPVPGYVASYRNDTQDTGYLAEAIGSQYIGLEESASEYPPPPDSIQLLDSRAGDEAAAWRATTEAYEQLRQTSYRKPKFSIIHCEDVDRALGELRRRNPEVEDREAVQAVLKRFLSRYLSRHPRGTNRDQARVTCALQEAACQLQGRVQGEEAFDICYLAIASVLATLRGEGSEPQEARGSSSSVGQPTSGQRFVCPVRDCKQGAFGRAADLDRHHKMVHLPDEEKKKFFCDYKKCPRHDSPFYRQDHFRDHLRDFHKEDLLRRGTKADGKWWDSRSKHAIFTGWWRCNKCLVTRVDIETNGWVCPKCSTHCETERKRFRSSGQR